MLADGEGIPQRSPTRLEIRYLPSRPPGKGGAAYVLTDDQGRMIGHQLRVTVSAGVDGGMVLVELVLDGEHVRLTDQAVVFEPPPDDPASRPRPVLTPAPVPPLVGLNRPSRRNAGRG